MHRRFLIPFWTLLKGQTLMVQMLGWTSRISLLPLAVRIILIQVYRSITIRQHALFLFAQSLHFIVCFTAKTLAHLF